MLMTIQIKRHTDSSTIVAILLKKHREPVRPRKEKKECRSEWNFAQYTKLKARLTRWKFHLIEK